MTRLAATVVLLRDGVHGLEVLMIERPHRGWFAGAWVFPGGKVDPDDRPEFSRPPRGVSDAPAVDARAGEAGVYAPDRAGDTLVDTRQFAADDALEEAAARRAAVREVREETALAVDPASLVVTARWEPPADAVPRFRTWFYLAESPHDEIALAEAEAIAYRWLTPAAALDQHADGRLLLVQPTWVTLHRLREHDTVAEALAAARVARFRDHSTRHTPDDTVMLWRPDVAFDDASLLHADGPRHRLDISRLPWVYTCTE
ncbi:NUDIX domain-containing protein [Ruicaihuangia caeni]|uniref:NUDIX domain-containing protein n=1 Tax=Ruicaihuangia caeni TaxID=3042517 RepID=A0AAW6T7Q8_9MICO|nr:NUDIX domain-containing protein [Klugiella sp. YN-L-19]MDI2099569.1 NUDIX domain-containing protein [Klugiella sp. YN-L-19]